jgi:hypothetical protein
MELGWTHKVEFKMRSTYTINERRQLLQVKWKWCSELSRDNLKHKIFKTHNLWEETPLPSLYYIMCFYVKTISKRHFSPRLSNVSPKTTTLVVPKLWKLISFSNKVFFQNVTLISYILETIFPKMYSTLQSDLIWPLFSRDLWLGVKFSIWLPPLLFIITHAN